jgi:hypothetical protein
MREALGFPETVVGVSLDNPFYRTIMKSPPMAHQAEKKM